MDLSKRNITLFAIILVALAGIITGYYISNIRQNTPNIIGNGPPESALNFDLENEDQQNAIKQADYLISSSSQGSLIKKHNVTLTYQENDQASASISNDTTNQIHRYQDVILHDQSEEIMPLGGKVKSITPKNNKTEIIIDLPPNTKTEYLSNNADIITLDSIASRRFPLTALQKNEDGQYYVWIVKKTGRAGKYQAIKFGLDHVLIGDTHFSSANLDHQTLIILEPTKKIKNYEIYNMAQIQYSAPTGNPIKEAYREYHKRKLFIQNNEAINAISKCQQNAENKKLGIVDDATTGSCTQNTLIPQKADPMEIFNAILSKQHGGGNNNCGSSSCQ